MTSEKRLIVNADGYGFTPGVNEGIVKVFEFGLVTSASCTPNFGHLGEAGVVQKRFPEISFGIHFNLNVGAPVAPADTVRSLLGDDGRFLGDRLLPRILSGGVKAEEMEIELTAQAALLADQDVRISHWDGHQNKHLWPMYFSIGAKVARKFNIAGIRSHRRLLFTNNGPLPLSAAVQYYLTHPTRSVTHAGGRVRTAQAEAGGFAAADHLITPGYADDSHKSMSRFWFALAESNLGGTSEVYCHPGYVDDLLRANAKYVDAREREVEVLTDPALKEAFQVNNVRLINFFDLVRERRK